MGIQIFNYTLHGRLTASLLVIAIISMVSYMASMVVIIEKLEESMMATLVGHELDELVTGMAEDPETPMPKTASVNAYLMSREHLEPIPKYLRELSPNFYKEILVGENTYQAAIFDLNDDRIYVSFRTTAISKYRSILLMMFIGGGLIAILVLVGSGFWLFRKFLLPVSELADEVSKISPTERSTRFEKKYRGYEVGLIAKSMDQFMDRLDDYIEREQSFTAAASHELRTPVAVIATATDLLELEGITDEQQRVVNRIKDSTRYMKNVIESLLFFVRNTQDAVEKTLTELDLKETFLHILKKYEEQASENNLVLLFKSKTKTKVRISENHLEIILGNLIRNAIANTDAGEVKVTLFENGFSVKDTGHGINADEIELITKRNYHSPDSSGSGLGLYLVKNVCNNYALTLDIKSIVGEGSEFFVIFPRDMIS